MEPDENVDTGESADPSGAGGSENGEMSTMNHDNALSGVRASLRPRVGHGQGRLFPAGALHGSITGIIETLGLPHPGPAGAT